MARKIEENCFYFKTYIEPKSYAAVQKRFLKNFNFNTYPGNPKYSYGIS